MPGRRKDFPLAFIIAFGLIVFSEGLHDHFDNRFYVQETATTEAALTGLDGFRMKVKNHLAQDHRKTFDALILGDSYHISGVIPAVLSGKTGMSVFNFAHFGDHGVFASYCLFKNYLKSHDQAPRYIVLGYQTDTLSRKRIAPAFMYDFRKGNSAAFIKEFGFIEGLKFQIPSLKHQHILRRMLLEAHVPVFLTDEGADTFVQSVIEEQGYFAPLAEQAVAEPAREADYNEKYRFSVSESSAHYLREILQMAAEKGTGVIYVMPTLSQDWFRLYSEHGVIAGYDAFLNDVQREFPSVHVVRYQSSIEDFSFYADRLHLNRLGAARLTHLISRDILEIDRIRENISH